MSKTRGIEPHRFKKGQSGNPKGRPKKLPALDVLMAEVLGDTTRGKDYATAILEAMRRKALKGDTKAAEILLDRAYGKPKQSHDLQGNLAVQAPIVHVQVLPPTRQDG